MSDALSVVVPIAITDATLISSTIPETDYAAWSSGTTYADGDRAIVVATHKVYESVVGANINNNPTSTTSTSWVEVSPTNRWKCFDTSNSTQTAKASTATYVLNLAQAVTNISLLNLTSVASVRIRMNDPTYGAVYDTTIYTNNIIMEATWYAFLLGTRTGAIVANFIDIPLYPGATITVDIVGGASMAFGVLLFGVATDLGRSVNYGVSLSIQDYSRKETNAYGDTILVQRAYSKKATFGLRLLSDDVDPVVEFLTNIRSTPCLWIGSSLYASTVIFGIYEDFDVVIAYFSESKCSLTILGLT